MENNAIVLNDAIKGKKYYAVHCKCGHVKPNRYVEIVFAIEAESGSEAAKIARSFSRVKHNRKNAIINCYQISQEKYREIIKINKMDPYLKCKNIQEQRMIKGFEDRIMYETPTICKKKTRQERKEFIRFKLRKQKEFIKALNVTMQLSA